MLLSALNDYAVRKKFPLHIEQDVVIPFAVLISKDGEYVSLVQCGEKKDPQLSNIPFRPTRSGAEIAPNFLLDRADYVLGWGSSPTAKKNKNKDCTKQHQAFVEFFDKVVDGASVSQLLTVKKFFTTGLPAARARLTDEADKLLLDRSHLVAIQIDDQDGEEEKVQGNASFVHELAEVQEIWRKFFEAALVGEDSGQAIRCIVTGEHGVQARVHPKVKVCSKGLSLTSFDKEAFCSYGKDQGENVAISTLGAYRCTRALSELIRARDRATKRQTNVIFYTPDGKAKLDSAFTVFWAQNDDTNNERSLRFVLGGDGSNSQMSQEAIREILRAPIEGGYAPSRSPDAPFYFTTMYAPPSQGRISVHNFTVASATATMANIRRYLSDSGAQDRNKGVSGRAARVLPLRRILLICGPKDPYMSSGEPAKEFSWTRRLALPVLRAIIEDKELPRELFENVLRRLCTLARSGKDWDATGVKKQLREDRYAFLRTYINRQIRHGKLKERELTMELDTHNTNKAYVFGRLFAVRVRMQTSCQKALNKTEKATLRDDLYALALTQPLEAYVLSAERSLNYLSRLENKKPGWATWLKKMDQELQAAILSSSAPGEPLLPHKFTSDEKAYFICGVAAQDGAFYAPKKALDSKEEIPLSAPDSDVVPEANEEVEVESEYEEAEDEDEFYDEETDNV